MTLRGRFGVGTQEVGAQSHTPKHHARQLPTKMVREDEITTIFGFFMLQANRCYEHLTRVT